MLLSCISEQLEKKDKQISKKNCTVSGLERCEECLKCASILEDEEIDSLLARVAGARAGRSSNIRFAFHGRAVTPINIVARRETCYTTSI